MNTSNEAANPKASTARNDSQFFIRFPRLARSTRARADHWLGRQRRGAGSIQRRRRPAPNPYRRRGEPAQAEHPEAPYGGQEFWPSIEQAPHQFGAVLRVKILGQPHVENHSVMARRRFRRSGCRGRLLKTWRFPAV